MIIILSFILRTAQYVTKIVERAQRAEDARSPLGTATPKPNRSAHFRLRGAPNCRSCATAVSPPTAGAE